MDEESLLLRCTRAALAGGPLKELPPSIPWERLRTTAERHQVQGLLWETVQRSPWAEKVPAETGAALRLEFHRHGLRNQMIRKRIVEILATAERKGIPLLLLKGAVLAWSAYANPGHRTLGDVDLLAREEDFAGLREVLAAAGYHTQIPSLEPGDLPWYAHCYRQIRFAAARVPPLEIHFRLLNLGRPPPSEPAWEDARCIPFAGRQALIPSPERFLLHLCLHAQQHGFALLRLLVDVGLWQRTAAIDAGRFAELARRHRLAIAAYYALTYAEEMLGLTGPAELRAHLRPPAWKARCFEILWKDRQVRALAVPLRPAEAELPRAFLLGEASPGDKLAFLRRILFPPRAWLAAKPAPAVRRRHWARLLSAAWRELRTSLGPER
jgi:putative nucleotidyltransferase-like protein